MNSKIISKPIETTLKLAGFWPEYFAPPYISISLWMICFHLIFQYWEASLNMKNINFVMNHASDLAITTLFFMKFAIMWNKRR